MVLVDGKPWNFKTNPHFYLPTLNTILRLKRFSRNGMKNWRGSPNVTLINACLLTTVPNVEKYVSSHYQIQKQYLHGDHYGPKNILNLKLLLDSEQWTYSFHRFSENTKIFFFLSKLLEISLACQIRRFLWTDNKCNFSNFEMYPETWVRMLKSFSIRT